MKYIDKDGDTWEDVGDGDLACTQRLDGGVAGAVMSAEHVTREYGPLRPVDGQEPQDAPSQPFPTVEGVMSRASVFQSAHALVTGLPWGEEEKPSVYDVLSVAKWLEGEE